MPRKQYHKLKDRSWFTFGVGMSNGIYHMPIEKLGCPTQIQDGGHRLCHWLENEASEWIQSGFGGAPWGWSVAFFESRTVGNEASLYIWPIDRENKTSFRDGPNIEMCVTVLTMWGRGRGLGFCWIVLRVQNIDILVPSNVLFMDQSSLNQRMWTQDWDSIWVLFQTPNTLKFKQ